MIKKDHLILIVDDAPANLQVLGSILSEQGYQIILADNGLQPLKSIEKFSPDLILLDVNMPGMNGFETCQRLKELEKTAETPIIFLTARTSPDDILDAFSAGAVDYITKPFNNSELLIRVRSHLDLKDKTDTLRESNSKVNELLRVLLHDIGNPLAGIRGIVEYAQKKPEIYQTANTILEMAISNCFTILENVKKMKSLEEGKQEIHLEPIHLQDSIQKAIRLFEQKLSNKNLDVEISISPKFSVLVEDATFIHSVFNNLFTNAMKFSFPNSKIKITAYEKNKFICLSIRDYGIGIPENILKNIFSFTHPTSRPGTIGENGTGYGMPLVKKFIETYGGKIEIHSSETEDRGTEIILYLKSSI